LAALAEAFITDGGAYASLSQSELVEGRERMSDFEEEGSPGEPVGAGSTGGATSITGSLPGVIPVGVQPQPPPGHPTGSVPPQTPLWVDASRSSTTPPTGMAAAAVGSGADVGGQLYLETWVIGRQGADGKVSPKTRRHSHQAVVYKAGELKKRQEIPPLKKTDAGGDLLITAYCIRQEPGKPPEVITCQEPVLIRIEAKP
jgi:hypothetical protein